MEHKYSHHNRRKYSLKVHIVLVTKYRKQLLKGCIADDVKQKIYDIYNRKGIDIVAMETDKDHIHLLIRYDATDRVCDIVKLLKQETTYYLWQNIRITCPDSIGNGKFSGLTVILFAVLEKYRHPSYKNTSSRKDNEFRFTRLLPPPKG